MQEVVNFFPSEIQKELYKLVSSSIFPWYYTAPPNLKKYQFIQTICNNDKNIVLKPGFQHLVYNRNHQKCNLQIGDKNVLDLFVYYTEQKYNLRIKVPLRILVLLSLPDINYPKDSYLLPHVDLFTTHKTCLYYINDSDGDTFIFKEKCMVRDLLTKDSMLLLEKDNNILKKTLLNRVTPVQGKSILFNGLNYHAGSLPRLSERYIINFNFK